MSLLDFSEDEMDKEPGLLFNLLYYGIPALVLLSIF
jgi:hypothetical protein